MTYPSDFRRPSLTLDSLKVMTIDSVVAVQSPASPYDNFPAPRSSAQTNGIHPFIPLSCSRWIRCGSRVPMQIVCTRWRHSIVGLHLNLNNVTASPPSKREATPSQRCSKRSRHFPAQGGRRAVALRAAWCAVYCRGCLVVSLSPSPLPTLTARPAGRGEGGGSLAALALSGPGPSGTLAASQGKLAGKQRSVVSQRAVQLLAGGSWVCVCVVWSVSDCVI